MKPRFQSILILLILCGISFAPALADTVKLGSDGTLHRIEVIPLEGSTSDNPKTYLLHTIQKADGTIQKYTIPQTDDTAADIEPQIDLDPSSLLPSLVWSRFDGLDYEIAYSSFNGVRWSSPMLITVNSSDDREPQIAMGASSKVRIVWKDDSPEMPVYYHIHVSSMLLAGVTPQVLIPPVINLVLPDGTTPPTSTYPTNESIFFIFYVRSPHPKRLVVWGGHDDPSPINFQQGFKLPDTVDAVSFMKAQKVNGRLTIIFRSDNSLYYTYRTISGWTPYRMIAIDESMSEGKAVLLIRDMIGNLPN